MEYQKRKIYEWRFFDVYEIKSASQYRKMVKGKCKRNASDVFNITKCLQRQIQPRHLPFLTALLVASLDLRFLVLA